REAAGEEKVAFFFIRSHMLVSDLHCRYSFLAFRFIRRALSYGWGEWRLINRASRLIPSSICSSLQFEKFNRMQLAPRGLSPTANAWPGMKATCTSLTALSSSPNKSLCPGISTQMNSPLLGLLQKACGGKWSDKAASIQSRLILYSRRKRPRCSSMKPESRKADIARCVKVDVLISLASLMIASFGIRAGGA